MGSTVSCTSNTKVNETVLQKQDKSKPCIEVSKSSSAQQLQTNHSKASPSKNIVTPPPTHNSTMASNQTSKEALNKEKEVIDDKDAGTEKSKTEDEGKKEKSELMTDEEIEEFRTKTFDYLRETATAVVSLQPQHDKGGEFVTKIRNASLKFMQSYFALKKTVRENIHKFRRDLAVLMMETKYFNLSCEIVMYTYKNGWRLDNGTDDQKKYIPLSNSMVTLLNFSDGCDDFAIALANEPGFLETLKQILKDFVPKYFGNGEESKLVVSEVHLSKNHIANSKLKLIKFIL